jgi:AraC-like DNA-binding protein
MLFNLNMTPSPPGAVLTVEDWSTLQSRLLWCYDGSVERENRRQFSSTRHLCAWWMKRGSVTVKQKKERWSAREGEWLFCGPEPRHQEFSDDAQILSINFKMEWPSGDSLVDESRVVPARRFPELLGTAKPLVAYIRKAFPERRTDLWKSDSDLTAFFELQRLFAAWVSSYLIALRASGVVPARMTGMDSRVLAALQERRVAIKKIAYDLGFSSSSHFCHWLQKETGKSPREIQRKGD